MNSHIWIQVSVNIGQKCLKIEIQRNESIENVVTKFISSNKLSVKYEPIISNMIKEEIKKRMVVEEMERPVGGSRMESSSSAVSSMSSGLGDPLCNQSMVGSGGGKENGLLAEVMRIQTETNRKRAERLSELRQTSQGKNNNSVMDKSAEEGKQMRPSFKKFEVVRQGSQLGETPKMMAADTSRQSSEQTFRQHTEEDNSYIEHEKFTNPSKTSSKTSSNKQSKSNIIDPNPKQLSNEITSDIAQLKHLLLSNQAFNSHNSNNKSSSQQQSLWGQPHKPPQPPPPSQPLRLKTQTPQTIYQKWRKLDQQKKILPQPQSKNKSLKPHHLKSKSPVTKRQDTFFYNKGKSFLEEKNKKVESKFNEIYPFKTSKTPVNSRAGLEATNRLFKESKEYFSKKMVKPRHVDLDLSLKVDPIREKVRQRDRVHDEIISELISEGKIKSPGIGYREKSPFRKTVYFN